MPFASYSEIQRSRRLRAQMTDAENVCGFDYEENAPADIVFDARCRWVPISSISPAYRLS